MSQVLVYYILTDLLIANPNSEKMVDAWVKGTLPMVKDAEIKVIMRG